MKKAVEGAAIKPIESSWEGLLGLKSHPIVHGHRMLMRNITHPRFHLITQRRKLARREEVLDHNKPISLEIGASSGFQPPPPSAKGFGKFHPSTVQLKLPVQDGMTDPRIPKALGARQQREHGGSVDRTQTPLKNHPRHTPTPPGDGAYSANQEPPSQTTPDTPNHRSTFASGALLPDQSF